MMFAVTFGVISGQSTTAILINVLFGTYVGITMYVVFAAITNSFSLDGLANAAVDAFLFTAATIFVTSFVGFIKYAVRTKPIKAELQSYELDPRSIAEAKQGDPSWGTFRRKVWQNEATFRPELYDDQVARMLNGLAPQVNGKPMHLHHVVGKANDMYNVIKVTQAQHIAIHKAIGYHYNAMWTLENILHLL